MIEACYSRYYKLAKGSLKFSTNAPLWFESVENYLGLPILSACEKPLLEIEFIEGEPEQLNDAFALIDDDQEAYLVTIALNKHIPMRCFIKEHEEICDYTGYARTYLDYASGRARVFILKNSGIDTYYSIVILVYNMLNNLLHTQGLQAVHSAGLVINGKGILLTGNSGRGKSTASMALMTAGHSLMSDEKVLLYKAEGRYWGYSTSPVIKIRTEARKKFFPGLDPNAGFFQGEDEAAYRIENLQGGMFCANAPIHYLLTLEQSGISETSIEPINPTHTVGELFPVSLRPADRYRIQEKFDFLMDFLCEIPCYKVRFGTDMGQFVQCVEELVSR